MESIVLIVEDDFNDQELIRICLSECKHRHEVVMLKDGEEALAYLQTKEQRQHISFILMDLKLPKINGHEILKFVREQSTNRYTPVVIFTSSKEEKDIFESYALGVNAFIRKPIEFTEFSETIKNIGNFWLRHNQTTTTF